MLTDLSPAISGFLRPAAALAVDWHHILAAAPPALDDISRDPVKVFDRIVNYPLITLGKADLTLVVIFKLWCSVRWSCWESGWCGTTSR